MSKHIEQISAVSAMDRARKNTLRRYPSPDRDGDRLYPLATPNCSPSFQIKPEDTIFAIGSCFARNVEKSLESVGKRVLSREFELGPIGESIGDAANFFNKYSIQSVTNEIRWALERDTFPGADLFYEIGKESYSDCQLGTAKLDFPIEEILDFRHRYLDAMQQVATADVVILTLGYVETWYDRKLGLYLNVAPPMPMLKTEPDRFEFRVLSYSDVLEGLNDFFNLLQKHGKPGQKMLFTVSPVPLLATFRDMDVLVANAYSKSVQRAALDEFLLNKTGADYFPSYEFVTLSNPSVAWSRGDFRHVSPDVVHRIMENVLSNYVVDDESEPKANTLAQTAAVLLPSLRMMTKLGEHQSVIDLTQRNRDLSDQSVDVLLMEATALRHMGQIEDAWNAVHKAVQLAPGRPMPLERLITLCRPLKRFAEAETLAADHERKFPDRKDFRDRLDWI